MRARALVLVLVGLSACDESQVWHELDPTTARMLTQARADPYSAPMREPPRGTVPVDAVEQERPPLSRELLASGRRAFDDTCAACHGLLGDGDSVVATKMVLRRPPSLLDPQVAKLSTTEVYNVVTYGYGLMPPYSAQLSFVERWGVVAYVRALQLSEGAEVASLPQTTRTELEKAAR